jgi:hypothetical protein
MYRQVLNCAHGGSACAGPAARTLSPAPAGTAALIIFTATIGTSHRVVVSTNDTIPPATDKNGRPRYGRGGSIESHPSDNSSSSCPSGSRIIADPSVTVASSTAPPNSATFASTPGRSDTENEMCVSPT